MRARPASRYLAAALVSVPLLAACSSSDSAPPAPPCTDPLVCPEVRLERGGTGVLAGSTLAFAPTQTTGHRDVVLTVRNSGGATLSLTGTPRVQLSGPDAADFLVAAEPDPTVAVSAATSFTLRFEPASAGTKTVTVTIPSDAVSGPVSFAAEGMGRDAIWLFGSAENHSGNLGGRAGADAICAADYAAAWDAQGCATVHALLSVSATDSAAALGAPAGHEVRMVTDAVVETSWAGLWDGAILTGLTPILGNWSWWSGSNADGATFDTCGSWTGTGTGTFGSPHDADLQWIRVGGIGPCGSVSMRLVCVCW